MKKYKITYLLTYNDIGIEITLPLSLADDVDPSSFYMPVYASVFADYIEVQFDSKDIIIKNDEIESYKFVLPWDETIENPWDISTAYRILGELYGICTCYYFYELYFFIEERELCYCWS